MLGEVFFPPRELKVQIWFSRSDENETEIKNKGDINWNEINPYQNKKEDVGRMAIIQEGDLQWLGRGKAASKTSMMPKKQSGRERASGGKR